MAKKIICEHKYPVIILFYFVLVLSARSVIDSWQMKLIPEILLAFGLVLSVEISNLMIEFKKTNSIAELIQCIAAPTLVYLEELHPGSGVLRTVLIVTGAGSIYIAGLIILNRGGSVKKNAIRIMKGICTGTFNIRLILIVIMCISMFNVRIVPVLQTTQNSNCKSVEWSEDRTIGSRYEKDQLYLLEDNRIDDVDPDGRRKLFEAVVDIECNECNVPKLKVIVTDLLGSGVVAAYRDSEKVVFVDREYLENGSAKDLIATASHEVNHARQHMYTRIWLQLDEVSREFFKASFEPNIETLVDEFNHYKEYEEENYNGMYCEKDCRSYEEERYKQWVEQLSREKDKYENKG